MIRLIGARCKHSNVYSQGVLIVRFLLGNLEIIPKESEASYGTSYYHILSIQFSDIIYLKYFFI